jgi:hypothetical protein
MAHDSFTLVCLLIRGNVAYTSDYVVKLRSMVRRHTTKDFNVVCLTDGTFDLPPDIDTIDTPAMGKGERGFWRKPLVFIDKEPCFAKRMLFLDLDVLVVGDLDPIIDYPVDFAIAADSAPDFQGLGGKKVCKGFNSSVMVWDKGSRGKFAKAGSLSYRREFFSDQDAIKMMSPSEITFPKPWIRRLSHVTDGNWGDEAKIILCIGCKNHKAVHRYEWFDAYWR